MQGTGEGETTISPREACARIADNVLTTLEGLVGYLKNIEGSVSEIERSYPEKLGDIEKAVGAANDALHGFNAQVGAAIAKRRTAELDKKIEAKTKTIAGLLKLLVKCSDVQKEIRYNTALEDEESEVEELRAQRAALVRGATGNGAAAGEPVIQLAPESVAPAHTSNTSVSARTDGSTIPTASVEPGPSGANTQSPAQTPMDATAGHGGESNTAVISNIPQLTHHIATQAMAADTKPAEVSKHTPPPPSRCAATAVPATAADNYFTEVTATVTSTSATQGAAHSMAAGTGGGEGTRNIEDDTVHLFAQSIAATAGNCAASVAGLLVTEPLNMGNFNDDVKTLLEGLGISGWTLFERAKLSTFIIRIATAKTGKRGGGVKNEHVPITKKQRVSETGDQKGVRVAQLQKEKEEEIKTRWLKHFQDIHVRNPNIKDFGRTLFLVVQTLIKAASAKRVPTEEELKTQIPDYYLEGMSNDLQAMSTNGAATGRIQKSLEGILVDKKGPGRVDRINAGVAFQNLMNYLTSSAAKDELQEPSEHVRRLVMKILGTQVYAVPTAEALDARAQDTATYDSIKLLAFGGASMHECVSRRGQARSLVQLFLGFTDDTDIAYKTAIDWAEDNVFQVQKTTRKEETKDREDAAKGDNREFDDDEGAGDSHGQYRVSPHGDENDGDDDDGEDSEEE